MGWFGGTVRTRAILSKIVLSSGIRKPSTTPGTVNVMPTLTIRLQRNPPRLRSRFPRSKPLIHAHVRKDKIFGARKSSIKIGVELPRVLSLDCSSTPRRDSPVNRGASQSTLIHVVFCEATYMMPCCISPSCAYAFQKKHATALEAPPPAFDRRCSTSAIQYAQYCGYNKSPRTKKT